MEAKNPRWHHDRGAPGGESDWGPYRGISGGSSHISGVPAGDGDLYRENGDTWLLTSSRDNTICRGCFLFFFFPFFLSLFLLLLFRNYPHLCIPNHISMMADDNCHN